MDAALAENIFPSEESTPECSCSVSLADCKTPLEEINAQSARVRSWLRIARAGGTDYLVIILTPWGEGEVSWSCNVTFDFKSFLRPTFSFLTRCTLRQLVYVAHWGVGELSQVNLFLKIHTKYFCT